MLPNNIKKVPPLPQINPIVYAYLHPLYLFPRFYVFSGLVEVKITLGHFACSRVPKMKWTEIQIQNVKYQWAPSRMSRKITRWCSTSKAIETYIIPCISKMKEERQVRLLSDIARRQSVAPSTLFPFIGRRTDRQPLAIKGCAPRDESLYQWKVAWGWKSHME